MIEECWRIASVSNNLMMKWMLNFRLVVRLLLCFFNFFVLHAVYFFLFIHLLFLFFCSQLYTHSFSFGTSIYYFPLLLNWNNSKVLGKMAHVILEPGSVNNFPRTFSALKPPIMVWHLNLHQQIPWTKMMNGDFNYDSFLALWLMYIY